MLDHGRFVEVGGERIHLIERGTGPPLLLVHGFPSNAAAWSAIVPRLEAERSMSRSTWSASGNRRAGRAGR